MKYLLQRLFACQARKIELQDERDQKRLESNLKRIDQIWTESREHIANCKSEIVKHEEEVEALKEAIENAEELSDINANRRAEIIRRLKETTT